MNRLLSGQDAVIHGDGLQTRDFVHVADVVAANQASFLRRVGGTMNVGTGTETSVRELYGLAAAACGTERPPRFGPAKPGEQRRSVLDVGRARERLGLAELVPLEEGCTRRRSGSACTGRARASGAEAALRGVPVSRLTGARPGRTALPSAPRADGPSDG